MKLLPILLLALSCVLAGCRSPEHAVAPDAIPACTCGDPEAAFDGCAHPLCISGQRNPENPACVCGPLEFEVTGAQR